MRRVTIVVALGLVAAGSVGAEPTPPEPSKISYYYDAVDQNLVRPIGRFFDPAHLWRKVSANKRECDNVDLPLAIPPENATTMHFISW
jgi:hypothetical protein